MLMCCLMAATSARVVNATGAVRGCLSTVVYKENMLTSEIMGMISTASANTIQRTEILQRTFCSAFLDLSMISHIAFSHAKYLIAR